MYMFESTPWQELWLVSWAFIKSQSSFTIIFFLVLLKLNWIFDLFFFQNGSDLYKSDYDVICSEEMRVDKIIIMWINCIHHVLNSYFYFRHHNIVDKYVISMFRITLDIFTVAYFHVTFSPVTSYRRSGCS